MKTSDFNRLYWLIHVYKTGTLAELKETVRRLYGGE